FWAPDIILDGEIFHMYLTYVPGTFSNWSQPREIIHLISKDLKNWHFQSVLPVGNHKVIDAEVVKIKEGHWRMWYNNESDKKSIYYADSEDLYYWKDKGKAFQSRGEGPEVFYWQGKYFMIIDAWKGMEVYSSTDLLHWEKQEKRILEFPGTGKDDQAIGGHCSVIVNNNKAYIFYFTHPGRNKQAPAVKNSFDDKRSVIQLAELKYVNDQIVCERDAPVKINLKGL
ncbi:MAG: glycosyl hydrolase, partial [Niabella sp.]